LAVIVIAGDAFNHVALFAAHMGNIHHGQGIAGQNNDDGTRLNTRQRPAGHQGRQRTFQSPQIQRFVFHPPYLSVLARAVNADQSWPGETP
jgi:hypothetical protein